MSLNMFGAKICSLVVYIGGFLIVAVISVSQAADRTSDVFFFNAATPNGASGGWSDTNTKGERPSSVAHARYSSRDIGASSSFSANNPEFTAADSGSAFSRVMDQRGRNSLDGGASSGASIDTPYSKRGEGGQAPAGGTRAGESDSQTKTQNAGVLSKLFTDANYENFVMPKNELLERYLKVW